jgi:hypothetical protein
VKPGGTRNCDKCSANAEFVATLAASEPNAIDALPTTSKKPANKTWNARLIVYLMQHQQSANGLHPFGTVQLAAARRIQITDQAAPAIPALPHDEAPPRFAGCPSIRRF